MSATFLAVETLSHKPLGGTDRVSQQRKTQQIRVTDDVADMAEELAALLKKGKPDLLSDLLRPILKRELQKELDRRAKELRGQTSKE